MTLHLRSEDDTSSSSSDSEGRIEQSNFNVDDVEDEHPDEIDEPPKFDSSKVKEYKIKYQKTFNEVVGSQNVYILSVDGQKSGETVRIVTALSNFFCKVFNFEHGVMSAGEVLKHNNRIVDVKFDSRNNTELSSLVFTGSQDGTIKLWDLRLKEKCVSIFKDNTNDLLKPLSCFDVSCDGRFLVAGTDVIKDDAFLLFWDIRSTNLLGGYWDTHQGDITQVKFHPTEEKTVISGSVDGIINLFDVTQTTEKDALQLSLNTDSSISNLRWLKNKNEDSIISCITHTEDLQLWHTTNSSPYIIIPRDKISSSMNIKPDVYCQVIDCHQTDKNGNLMLLVGSNYGKGEYLQSLDINDGSELSPRSLFNQNKQIIRCSWYDYNSGLMVTGGEAGIINMWVPSDRNGVNIASKKCSYKELPKVSLKNRTSKPY